MLPGRVRPMKRYQRETAPMPQRPWVDGVPGAERVGDPFPTDAGDNLIS